MQEAASEALHTSGATLPKLEEVIHEDIGYAQGTIAGAVGRRGRVFGLGRQCLHTGYLGEGFGRFEVFGLLGTRNGRGGQVIHHRCWSLEPVVGLRLEVFSDGFVG